MKERIPSAIWEHFNRSSCAEERARCNYCEKVLSLKGKSNGNLYRHMRMKHKEIKIREWDKYNCFREKTISEEEKKKIEEEANLKRLRKKRPVSFVWSHFTRSIGQVGKAKCNYCGKIVSGATTSHFRKHMQKYHKAVELPPPRKISPSKTKEAQKVKEKEKLMGKRGRRPTSDVWDHFSRPSGPLKRVECNYCETTISGLSTCNLIRHLQNVHKIITLSQADKDCSLNLISITEEESTTTEEAHIGVMEVTVTSVSLSQEDDETSSHYFPAPSIEMDSPCGSPLPDYDEDPPSSSISPSTSEPLDLTNLYEIENPIPYNKSQAINAQLTKFLFKVSKECHPFSLVKEEKFKRLVKLLCRGYHIPDSETINRSLAPSLYRTTSDELKFKLSQATAICLTVDGWVSIKGTFFYAVMAHYLGQDMKLRSNLIECSEFEDNHTATNISDWLDEVFKNWAIGDKIVATVIGDNVNVIEAIDGLAIQQISCYAHTLNLLVQNAIDDSITDIVSKVEATVKFFKRNSTALAKLKEKQSKINESQDVPSNWNSTFEMFKGLFKNKKSIIFTLSQLHTKHLSNLETREWEVIEHAVTLLEYFEEVKREIRPDKNVSLSETCILTRVLLRRVEKFMFEKQKTVLPNEVTKLGNLLLEGLNKKLRDRENSELISQALFLDPRFKKQGFGDKDKYRTTYDALAEKMQEMNTFLPSHPTSHNDQGKSNFLWKEFDAKIEQQYAINDTTIELNKYIEEPIIHRTSDPLAWWRERKSVYPNLYEIARERLCIPATYVPCERLPKAEQTLNEDIFRLTSLKVAQMLFLNSNVK